MKRKHFFSMLGLLLLIVLGIYSCKKEQTSSVGTQTVSEQIASDESFKKLNLAMDRFDPQYLSIVYHNPGSAKEISDAGIELIKKLAADPDNAIIAKEFASFYHFNSVEELTAYSKNISEGIEELDKKFNFKKAVLQNDKAGDYLKARAIYIKDRYNSLTLNNAFGVQKKTNAVGTNGWEETTEQLVDYYRYMMNQGFVGDTDTGGGSGSDCTESCCWERESCKSIAKSKMFQNLWIYGIGGAAGTGTAGFASGSVVPFWGNIAGAIVGGLWGGSWGVIIVMNIYQNDLEACNATYKACIQKKSGN